MKRNPNFRSHPALVWGLLLNAAALLLRDEWPVPPPLPLGDLLQGAALGLMLVGLLLSDPRRAVRIRNWKANHWKL